MKGLLIKDWKLMKNQKNFFAVVLLLAFAFSAFYENPAFVFSYVPTMCCVFTISTVTYDSYDNGEAFLFTLPVTRKGYVKEKYLFALIITAVSLAGVSILTGIFRHVRGILCSPGEYGMYILTGFVTAAMMISVLLPIQLKFGAEKSRVVLATVVGGVFLAVVFLMSLNVVGGAERKSFRIFLLDNKYPLIAGCAVVFLMIVAISFLISLRVMEKKEF